MTPRLRFILAALTLATAACTGPTEQPAVTPEDPTTTSVAGDATTITTTTESPSTTSAPETAIPAGEVIQGEPLIPDYPPITVFTPSSGGGTRPLLEWDGVAEAAFYSVVVYDGDGEPYWATLTDETKTYVGGSIQILEDRPGPRVAEGGAWSVVALDGEGIPLAASGIAPIAP